MYFFSLTNQSILVIFHEVLLNIDYIIDFTVHVNDPSKTLVGNLLDGSKNDPDSLLQRGKYFVMLTDEDGNISGILQENTGENVYSDVSLGSYKDYTEYPMDVTNINNKFRFRGLVPDKKYTIQVYKIFN